MRHHLREWSFNLWFTELISLHSRRGERSNTAFEQESNSSHNQTTMVSDRNQISRSTTSRGALKRHKQKIPKPRSPQLRAALKSPIEAYADLVIQPQSIANPPPSNPYDVIVYWFQNGLIYSCSINIPSASTMSTSPEGGMRYDIARAMWVSLSWYSGSLCQILV